MTDLARLLRECPYLTWRLVKAGMGQPHYALGAEWLTARGVTVKDGGGEERGELDDLGVRGDLRAALGENDG